MTVALPSLEEETWLQYRREVQEAQGYVLLEKAPLEFRKRNDVFGAPQPDGPLIHQLKAALDPGDIFAPGRLPGKE